MLGLARLVADGGGVHAGQRRPSSSAPCCSWARHAPACPAPTCLSPPRLISS